ncbi:MAG: outer membrane beta-barrel protein [Xanthomonadaceae bacterium]|nr:outer membrane beta-barrel protein [Xanthomonadaceae bacterium]MDE1965604.1 outer membrane beta-barrel protein [Xanthomonadaceae bacterium]
MIKRLTIATAAMALACLSSSSLAASPSGRFFLDGAVGRATWHDGDFNAGNTHTAAAWRVGYAWNRDRVSYGLEAGYVDLGTARGRDDFGATPLDLSAGATGVLAGVNVAYRFARRLSVHARLGWMHDRLDVRSGGYRERFSGDGGYVGIGAGYRISKHLGVGLAYDRYTVRGNVNGSRTQDFVGMFSGFADVRF